MPDNTESNIKCTNNFCAAHMDTILIARENRDRINTMEMSTKSFAEEYRKTLESIFTSLDRIKDRPPAWCSIAFGVMGVIIGYMTHALIKLMPIV
jgi:hypothetical protein